MSDSLPSTRTLLLRGIRRLATMNESLGEIDDAAVFIQGNVINWVGKDNEIPAEIVLLAKAGDVIDCSDRIVIPGMINTHHHMYQTLTRCMVRQTNFGSLTLSR